MSNKIKLKTSSIKKLVTWTSPERIWEEKDQSWYLKYTILFFILILIFIRIEQYFIIIGIIAFMFLWFVQGTIKPWEIDHSITNKGILSHSNFYKWDEFDSFWMNEKKDWLIINLRFKPELKKTNYTILVTRELEKTTVEPLLENIQYANSAVAGSGYISRKLYGKYIPITKYIGDEDKILAKELAKNKGDSISPN